MLSQYLVSSNKINDNVFHFFLQNRYKIFILYIQGKPNCPKCDEFENELAGIRENLVDSLDASVVKVVSSPLAKLYSPSLEPAIVFFRHGTPMLYHGQ